MKINMDFKNMDHATTDAMVDSLFKQKNFRLFKETLPVTQRELVEGFENSLNCPFYNDEQIQAGSTAFKMCMVACMDNTELIPETTVSELKETLNKKTLSYEDYHRAFLSWYSICNKYNLV